MRDSRIVTLPHNALWTTHHLSRCRFDSTHWACYNSPTGGTPLRSNIAALVLAGFLLTTNGVKADAPARVLAYQMKPGQTQRYKLTATIKANMPFLESITPVDLDVVISLVYLATPKTLLADGTSDVECKVDSVDVTLATIPFPIAVEDVQKILNQTITIAQSGEIKKAGGGGPPPINVSIPGVDPTRLYALLYPVVFQQRPVKPGDTWSFKSNLLAGEGAAPSFKATILPPQDGDTEGVTRLRETLSMKVDQKLDGDKKPVVGNKPVHRTRKGAIEGEGDLQFSASEGRFTKSVVKLKANIVEKLLGKPSKPDEPKEVTSKVAATVTVELQPETTADGKSGEKQASK